MQSARTISDTLEADGAAGKILCLTSSPRRDTSYSNLVAMRVLRELRQVYPDATVTIRDLARNPLAHIDEDFVIATRSVAGARTERQRAQIERSDALVDELIEADVLVIAAPMVNFGVPSTLKAWVDHVVRPDRTFRYSGNGAQGLLRGRRAILVLSRGGIYSGGPLRAFEHDESYLRSVLEFMGINDVQTILIEGMALGPEFAERAIDAAMRRAGAVAGVLAAA
ncbi:MAG: FMN-dependent NADH-azoreductase [Hyphomicrobium sp.]|jgi:FMN-dependent NADH-azoreductase